MTEKMKKPVYLDHHATTPMDPLVLEEMLPYFTDKFGNASSSGHLYGWESSDGVEHARKQVAKAIGARAKDIIFTSGGTESDNLAVMGPFLQNKDSGKNHIITTAVEHKAILESCKRAERLGAEITYLPVDKHGCVSVEQVLNALTDKTVLVSVLWGNNEIGSLNPIEEIGNALKDKGVLFHTDAVQTLGRVQIDVSKFNVDLLSLSAHKVYGPKGVGSLYVNRTKNIRLCPLIYGGGQERGDRSGTLNVPAIVGMGKAVALCEEKRGDEVKRLCALRTRMSEKLKSEISDLRVNGHPKNKLCHNLSVTIPGVPAYKILSKLTTVAMSTGSACSSANPKPSYVLTSIGLSKEDAFSTIRFGLGRFNTEEEIDQATEDFIRVVKSLYKPSSSEALGAS